MRSVPAVGGTVQPLRHPTHYCSPLLVVNVRPSPLVLCLFLLFLPSLFVDRSLALLPVVDCSLRSIPFITRLASCCRCVCSTLSLTCSSSRAAVLEALALCGPSTISTPMDACSSDREVHNMGKYRRYRPIGLARLRESWAVLDDKMRKRHYKQSREPWPFVFARVRCDIQRQLQ